MGVFWKTAIGRKFNNSQRVDKRLLNNWRLHARKLHNSGLSYPVIHDLIGRYFYCLLEDRGALTGDYYGRFIDDCSTYFHVLKSHSNTYGLFRALGEKFNGDMFPITPEEEETVTFRHLDLLREFFLGTQMLSGQRTLWRPYDFSVIPIELVSSLYEKFLHKEEDEDAISDAGAYYTPHALVEFIMNEILPWPEGDDCNYNLRILNPTCGSGIFLVEAFRRLIARWMQFHKTQDISPETLKEILTSSIFGVDINHDAIKVAALSVCIWRY